MKKVYVVSLFGVCFECRTQARFFWEEHEALPRVRPFCLTTCLGFMLFLKVYGESILIGNLIRNEQCVKSLRLTNDFICRVSVASGKTINPNV